MQWCSRANSPGTVVPRTFSSPLSSPSPLLLEADAPLFPAHRHCAALTALVRERFAEAAPTGRRRRYGRSQPVWSPGDAADTLYVLDRGAVEVTRRGPENREVLLRTVEPGEPFGELCFCAENGGRRASTAAATAESEVLEVGLRDLLGALQRSGEALLDLVVAVCERLVDLEARAEVLAQRGAEPRLARLLLHLAHTQRRGRAGGDTAALYVTQRDLARLAAMSRSHVSVVLGRFRERGLVDYAPGRALVVDVPAIQALVNNGNGTQKD